MDNNLVLLEKEKGIATITMNRPHAYNALSPELIDRIIEAFLECNSDPDVKVIIFTGAGKAFCAGGDLPYMESIDNALDGRKYIVKASEVTSTITKLDKPVVAMVNGIAAGAGFNLAIACDIVICVESATFVQSFARVGLIPDSGGTYLLPRLVGLQKSKELMFTAQPIGANEALSLGLVNKIVESDKLVETTYQYAEKLSAAAPIAVSFIKRILNQAIDLKLETVLELEANMQTVCLQTLDNKEGIKAFKEKRLPVFKGE